MSEVSTQGIEPDARRALRAILAAFVFTTIYFTGVFPPDSNTNELSRFQTVAAMAEWKTFAIDRAIAALGDHKDISAAGGHFYSNKAPGLAFAAYPVYRFLRLFLPPPTAGTSNTIFYLLRLLTVSVVCFIAVWRFGRRLTIASGNPTMAPLITLAVVFGTPFLFYARTMFSHAWTASLLFLAWDLICLAEDKASRHPLLLAGASGGLAAWAVISEYTVAPIAVLLALRAGLPLSTRAIAFAVAAMVPLSLLLFYNSACFGAPWILSSARETAYSALASEGLFGIRQPNPRIALRLLFDPARGVFIFSPFLLWSIAGFFRWWRSGEKRADCRFLFFSALVFFVILSGYRRWDGGASLGSRYLLPAIFLAAYPLTYALRTPLSRGLFLVATGYSLASHVLLTSTFSHLGMVRWPAISMSSWFLSHGWVAENLASLMGAPLWLAFSIPAAVVVFSILFVAHSWGRWVSAPIAKLSTGIGLLVLLGLGLPELHYKGRLERASLFGLLSGRDPARRELASVVAQASTPEERKAASRYAARDLASP
jgi:hypothetical protein